MKYRRLQMKTWKAYVVKRVFTNTSVDYLWFDDRRKADKWASSFRKEGGKEGGKVKKFVCKVPLHLDEKDRGVETFLKDNYEQFGEAEVKKGGNE